MKICSNVHLMKRWSLRQIIKSKMRSFHSDWETTIKKIIIINTVLVRTRPLPWLLLGICTNLHSYVFMTSSCSDVTVTWEQRLHTSGGFCVSHFSEFVLVQVLVWKLQNLQISLQLFLLKPRWRPVSKAGSGWRTMWWWVLQTRSGPVRSG